MRKLFNALNHPFPGDRNLKESILGIFYIGLFVSAFLYVFEPFGIHSYPYGKPILALSFGMVTFTIGIGYELFCRYSLKIHQDEPQWVLWKWLIHTMILILFIAVGNFLFMTVFMYYKFGTQISGVFIFFQFIRNTVAIGVFPTVLIGVLRMSQSKKKHHILASTLSPIYQHTDLRNVETIILKLQSGETVQLPLLNIQYLQAMENYVSVHNRAAGNEQKQLLRITFKKIYEQLPKETFLQCHRSYIVNINCIDRIEGNSQGLILKMQNSNSSVPVSRKYIPVVKSRL